MKVRQLRNDFDAAKRKSLNFSDICLTISDWTSIRKDASLECLEHACGDVCVDFSQIARESIGTKQQNKGFHPVTR